MPLIATLLFLTRPVREEVLGAAAARLRDTLPGRLTIGRATWPSPGGVEIEALLWTLDGDTLLDVGRTRLDVDLPALVHRDLHVRRMEADIRLVDLPAIRTAVAGNAPPPDEVAAGGIPWLRTGALAPLPSAALDSLAVSGRRLITAPGAAVLDLVLSGGVELRHDHEPRLRLDATARDAASTWALDALTLDWAPADGVYAGDGHLRAGDVPPLRFALSGAGPDAFRLELDTVGLGADGPGLIADGVLSGDGGTARRLELTGAFRTPGADDLAGWGLVAAPPPLAPARGAFTLSTLWAEDGPEAELDLSLSPDALQNGAHLRAAYAAGRVRVDTLTIDAPGLRIAGGGSATEDTVTASVHVELDGLDWLRPFAPALADPAAALPESLSATLNLRLAGLLPAPAMTATLSGGARRDRFRLDCLSADVAVDSGWRTGRLDWSALAHGLGVAGTARLEWDDSQLRAFMPPLSVALGEAVAIPGPEAALGYAFADARLELEGLHIEGAIGRHALDAEWDGSGGRIAMSSAWPRPPEALSLVLADSMLARLAPLWDGDAAWTMTSDLRYGTNDGDIQADVSLLLPGPDRLATLAPKPPHVDDLGSLRADLTVRGVVTDLRTELDLSRTDWIDTGHAVAHVRGDTLILQDAVLSALGLDLHAVGALLGEGLAGSAELVVPDASLLARFDLPLDSPELSARLSLDAAGTRTRPEIDVRLDGDYRDARIKVPTIAAWARLDGDRLDVRADLPGGATLAGTRLDSLVVGYAGGLPGRGDGRVSLRAVGIDARAVLGARLGAGPPWVVDADTLSLSFAGHGLDLDAPCRLRADPETGAFALEGLSLSGELGRLDLDARGDRADLVAETGFALHPPDVLFPPTLPPAFRPATVSGEARFGADRLDVRLQADGLRLGAREDVRLELDATGPIADLVAHARLIADRDTLARATATIPGDLADRLAAGSPAPLSAEIVLTGLPLPPPDGVVRPGREIRLDGRGRIHGTSLAPSGDLDLVATAPGWDDLAGHRLRIRADLTAASDTTGGGLTTELDLDHAGTSLAHGRISLPGTAALSPAGFTPREDGRLEARLETHGLSLEEFAPLMPAAVGLQGSLDLNLSATGSVHDPALDGRLSLADGRATLPDGSWLTMRGSSRLAGRLTEPAVTGDLEITGGVLRLPDPPKALLPLHARPLLWDAAGAASAAGPGDTAAAETPRAIPKIRPIAKVRVTLPAGLWLRGQGLEVELAGDLELRTTADGRPDAVGELLARRGYYRFLGRTFDVERGTVTFEGEDILDPALDISLSTRLDGAIYRVALSGTLKRPVLLLTSDPELPEGDIMAILLFGRPLDELSGDQEGVVRDRATDLVTAFGTAQLEARLARQLNVDMVTLRRGGGPEGADALVIGKYLHQRVLLKYEQALDEWSTFVVNLEYFLSRRFKLETMISRQSQSAATVNWSVEY